ncbi:MAG: MerR family transcriptional regulator [bacterium]
MASNLNIKNCRECGKIFSGAPLTKICPDCVKVDEENFKKVRAYVNTHKGADMNVVAEETQVPKESIMGYLRSGKLQASKGLNDALACQKCGKAINTGKFCVDCSSSMAKSLDETRKPVREEPKKIQGGMHLKR